MTATARTVLTLLSFLLATPPQSPSGRRATEPSEATVQLSGIEEPLPLLEQSGSYETPGFTDRGVEHHGWTTRATRRLTARRAADFDTDPPEGLSCALIAKGRTVGIAVDSIRAAGDWVYTLELQVHSTKTSRAFEVYFPVVLTELASRRYVPGEPLAPGEWIEEWAGLPDDEPDVMWYQPRGPALILARQSSSTVEVDGEEALWDFWNHWIILLEDIDGTLAAELTRRTMSIVGMVGLGALRPAPGGQVLYGGAFPQPDQPLRLSEPARQLIADELAAREADIDLRGEFERFDLRIVDSTEVLLDLIDSAGERALTLHLPY